MYENIGGKIKIVAKVFCWIGIIVSIILAIILFISGAKYSSEESYISAVIYLLLGPLLSWIGSFFMYGFGELLERVKNIDVLISSGVTGLQGMTSSTAYNPKQNDNSLFGWKCVCGHMNPITADTCVCGRDKYGNQDNGVKQKSEEAKTPLPEADSEMVVCPSCGQTQKKNPFGCIYCHSPLAK